MKTLVAESTSIPIRPVAPPPVAAEPSPPLPSRRFRSDLVLVVGVAALVRLGWILAVSPHGPMQSDAGDYFQEAERLAAGTRGAAPFYWPPGTPYFLGVLFSLFGPSELVARLGLACVAALQSGIVAMLARDLCNSRLAGRVAGLIWALYPPAVLFSTQSGSQHLSGLCLASAALYAVRCARSGRLTDMLLCGASLGFGCLNRPAAVSVVAAVPVLALWFGWKSRSAPTSARPSGRRAAWPLGAILACGLVLLPTLAHNIQGGGGPTLSTNNERNFFIGNNPYTPLYKTSHLAQRPLEELSPEIQTYLRRHYEAPEPNQAMRRTALLHIRQEPGLFLLRTANRVRSFWGFDYLASRTLQSTHRLSGPLFLLVLAAEAGGYIVVMLLGLAGALRWRRLQPALRVWLVGLTGAYAMPYFFAFSAGTYHAPVMGLVIPFAAVALTDHGQLGLPWGVLRRRGWLVPALAFLGVQMEYAYFVLRHA